MTTHRLGRVGGGGATLVLAARAARAARAVVSSGRPRVAGVRFSIATAHGPRGRVTRLGGAA